MVTRCAVRSDCSPMVRKNDARCASGCHAASCARPYSWCRPPGIGVATTPWRGGNRCPQGRFLSSRRRFGDVWPEAGMRPTAMVVGHPLPQDPSQMSLMERDDPVQTFPAHGPDQPFTEGVGLRRPHRRLQHPRPHRLDGAVNRRSPRYLTSSREGFPAHGPTSAADG
jgi:hypothetical protein